MQITKYETDYYSWLMKNAGLLREKRLDEIDTANIAEELEAMGRNEKRELIHRMSILIAHLLKWKYQAVCRSRSWKNTIRIQRMDIKDLLEDSPSLRRDMETKLVKAYEKAGLKAEDETGIDRDQFPANCPFTLAEILDDGFLPDGNGWNPD